MAFGIGTALGGWREIALVVAERFETNRSTQPVPRASVAVVAKARSTSVSMAAAWTTRSKRRVGQSGIHSWDFAQASCGDTAERTEGTYKVEVQAALGKGNAAGMGSAKAVEGPGTIVAVALGIVATDFDYYSVAARR